MDPTTQYQADPLADRRRASALANDQILTILSDHHRSEWMRAWVLSDPVVWFNDPAKTAQAFANASLVIGIVNARVAPDDPRYLTLGVPDGTAPYVALGVRDRFAVDRETWAVTNLGPIPTLYVLAPAGAAVTIGERTVTAGDDGRAAFVLTEGDYTGQATLDGYQGGAFAVSVRRGGQTVESGLTLIPPIDETAADQGSQPE